MQVTIYKSADLITNTWSGGTTTQLYIYPPDANYSKGNFQVRISTAKVELEQSDFTPLPGVKRRLMVLEGEITISHAKHYSKLLKPFELDTFSGDWQTSSQGCCVDFNVMTKGNAVSELTALRVLGPKPEEVDVEKQWDTLVIYAVTGSVDICLSKQSHLIGSGEVLVIEAPQVEKLQITSNHESQVLITKISR